MHKKWCLNNEEVDNIKVLTQAMHLERFSYIKRKNLSIMTASSKDILGDNRYRTN
jgi:hypothetical protein